MLRIGIVGAGVGGVAAAVALRRSGHDVEVFERAAVIKEVGSGLTLWANATRVLWDLGVLDACLARCQIIDDFHLRQASGRLLMRIPIEAFRTPALAMHRADLQAAFLAKLPPSVLHVDHACSGLRQDHKGAFLTFLSGQEAGPFDLVLGADGVRSELRRYVLGEAGPLSYRGYTIWRGVADFGTAAAASSFAAGTISETWGRGQRFGILPLGCGRVCWYATANAPQPEHNAPEERRRSLLDRFSSWHAEVASLIGATPSSAILEHATFDRPVQSGWSQGLVGLLGDAAHPLTPNLGQGACLALEDAAVLGRLLALTQVRSDVPGALAAFERLRLPRVRAMARRCRWLGVLGQWQNPLAEQLRSAAVRMLPGRLFTHTSRAIQAYAADQVAPFTSEEVR